LLKSQFGLEAVIFHERLADDYLEFLPDTSERVGEAYYTISFLIPSSSVPSHSADYGITTGYTHQQFIHPASQRVFRQVVDASSLVLSEALQVRFAKAMRVLHLPPHFHMSQLEPLVTPITQDSALLEICNCTRRECPCTSDLENYEKEEKFEEYLAARNKGVSTQTHWIMIYAKYNPTELASQSWPQLTMIAPSQATCPNSHPYC
jgi:hypothetical protein